ncbi:exodeoxyribonuclease VII small subunit [Pseudoroseicyclus sp. CXY001]|uniref:exodeoxyribonuclease VII small subunit n=1 Tax=Pseudoroseicyclus sp. CXY001 TaxID=3242492 RepID=UPI003570B7BC
MSETPVDGMSFEAALAELEQVVTKLDRGEVPLEESIALYNRGAALKAHCEKKLAEAEEKVEKIKLSSGKPSGTEPFEA